MKLKWQWFLGGKFMCWISIIVFIIFILTFACVYVADPYTLLYMDVQKNDTTSIQEISEKYVQRFHVYIDHPIKYRFVRYKRNGNLKEEDGVLLGTFHEWNGVYYIDISVDMFNMTELENTVVHETRHMLVEYLKDEGIIDLTKHTEEVAQYECYYDNIFLNSMYLLKNKKGE